MKFLAVFACFALFVFAKGDNENEEMENESAEEEMRKCVGPRRNCAVRYCCPGLRCLNGRVYLHLLNIPGYIRSKDPP
uniref:U48-Deinotoxin-Dsu1g_1 n=1 Tax=Deinopis subrufa TaxID=1905329 RepID=A0A4Q8KDS6_DEISU